MGVQLAAKDKIHDWTTITEVSKHAEPAPYVVEDPHGTFHGEKIRVLRALRDDPLADMHSRGAVDDVHFAAGRKWQAYHRRATVGSISAIDTTKEAVDGGKGYDGITDDQIDAFKALAEAEEALVSADRKLGPEQAFVLRCILGEGLSASGLARRMNYSSQKRVSFIMRTFRGALGRLVVLWGLGTHAESQRRG